MHLCFIYNQKLTQATKKGFFAHTKNDLKTFVCVCVYMFCGLS